MSVMGMIVVAVAAAFVATFVLVVTLAIISVIAECVRLIARRP